MALHVVFVKNMVCYRCVLSVEEILEKAGIPFQKVLFGEIHLNAELGDEQKEILFLYGHQQH